MHGQLLEYSFSKFQPNILNIFRFTDPARISNINELNWVELQFHCSQLVNSVLLHRPSKDWFARLDGRLGKIARLTPVFL